jgi:Ca2+-binding RTX toxin-like protein
MANYTHLETVGSPAAPWFGLTYSNLTFEGPQLIIHYNDDDTQTWLRGEDFGFEGYWVFGRVHSMERRDSTGTVVFETVGDMNVMLEEFIADSNKMVRGLWATFGGNDAINGWSGTDHLHGGGGADAMNGFGGFDYADYSQAVGNVLADLATPSVNLGEALGDTYVSVEGVVGSRFDDRLRGDEGDNKLYGGEGLDILMGRGGADLLDGGAGTDWADYIGAAGSLTVDLTTGMGSGGHANGDSYVGIENVRTGNGADLVIGNGADNNLRGDAGADHLAGEGGADHLEGQAGRDTLSGGAGADLLDGGDGIDLADYSSAPAGLTADLLLPANNTGEAVGDSYVGIEGIRGSAFADRLFGDNSGSGTEGGNWLEGGMGADLLSGRGGYDFASYESASTGVKASLADPSVNTGAASGDSYVSIEGLVGSDFHDHLIGNSADNILIDFVTYADGSLEDTFEGGDGFDLVSYKYSVRPALSVDLSRDFDRPYSFGDIFISIEGVIGTDYNDTLIGTAGADLLRGEGGDDNLVGRGGADILIGGDGNDRYEVGETGFTIQERPGGGIDEIVLIFLQDVSLTDYTHIENLTYAGPGGGRISGDGRSNVLKGAILGDDVLDGGGGADTMMGRGGNDTYHVDSFYDVIIEDADASIDTVITHLSYRLGDNVENLILTGSGNLNATGNGGKNEIMGTNGANVIDGGDGIDRMIGLGGDDTYYVTNNYDVVVEAFGGGMDTVRTAWGWAPLADNVENLVYTGTASVMGIGNAVDNKMWGGAADDQLSGHAGNDTLYGGAGADWLIGSDGDDVLDGGTSGDTLMGGAGSDRFIVDAANDIVIEGVGGGTDEVVSSIDYTLGSYAENLTMVGGVDGTGNKFANVLTGSDQANRLDGGIGSDRLVGGGGDDMLTGGRDADTFVFKPGFGHDVITDFNASLGGRDVVEFDAVIFADAGAMLARSADTADGVLITVDTGNSLLIQDTTLTQLNAHPEDFYFV